MFGSFIDGQVFEENQDGNQGGGGGPAASEPGTQSAPPGFDPKAFKAEVIGEIRKDLNGIDKKNEAFRKEVKDLKGSLDGFKADFKNELTSTLQSLLKPQNHEDDEDEDDEPGTQQTQQHAAQGNQQQVGGQGTSGSGQGNAPQVQTPPTAATGARGAKTVKATPRELSQERQLRDLQARLDRTEADAKRREEAANQREADSFLRTEIAKHGFNSKRGPDDFFDLLRAKLERGDDGIVYGPQGSTLADFVKNEYEERAYLHPVKQANGSGAGQSAGGSASSFDLDRLSSASSTKDLDQAWDAVRKVLPSSALAPKQ